MGAKRDRLRGFSLPVAVLWGISLAAALLVLRVPVIAQAPLQNPSFTSSQTPGDFFQSLPRTALVEVTPLPLLHRSPKVQNSKAQPSWLSQYPDLMRLIAVRAFLRGAIHYAEGTYPNPLGVSPYAIILGQETFDSFADHPRRMVTLNWGTPYEVTSDAAGSCQFTSNTWDDLHREYPKAWRSDLEAFHPQNQDIGCLLLWTEMGGYKALMAGTSVTAEGRVAVDVEKFMASVYTSCKVWASFPCENGTGAYDHPQFGHQKAKTIEEMWRNFQVALEDQQRLVDFVFESIDRPQPTLASGR
ncbi:MAG TPA: hypothetical protein V6C84_15970 [Coleofasciculaceae cyanobacterium]